MIGNLVTTSVVIAAVLLLVRFWPAILAVLRRFDDTNRARIEGELRDRADHLAHFRHTLRTAEEQVEQVHEIDVPDERTGQPVKRFVFEGVWFGSRREATHARDDKIRTLARKFYMELPAALAARREDDKLGPN